MRSDRVIAAAATAAIFYVSSATSPNHVRVTVDRPFLFVIRDSCDGEVFMLGRIASLP